MSDVVEQLQMAELSVAKVEDVDALMEEASTLMTDIEIADSTKQKVEAALETIKTSADHEFTPAFVRRVDNLINTRGGVKVSSSGELSPIVSGTESFGLTLMPKEFRLTRIAGLESVIEEIYRDIKRWVNQLNDNYERRKIEFKASVESLEERLKETDIRIDYLDKISEGRNTFVIPGKIVGTFSKGRDFIKRDFDKGIENECNVLLAQLSFWSKEQNRYRNSIIRYFGKGVNENLNTEVYRTPLFKLDHKTTEMFGEIGTMMQYNRSPMLIGSAYIEQRVMMPQGRAQFSDPKDYNAYADILSECGFNLVKGEKVQYSDVTINTLTVGQLYTLKNVVNKLITLIKSSYEQDPLTDMDPDDVKDLLSWLRKETDSRDLAYQYNVLSSDYQFEVSKFKTSIIGYLSILASHILTLMNLSMECYDVRPD